MTPDPSTRADRIVEDARARRPRWRSTSRVPAWFRGEELDVLRPPERRELYKQLRWRHQIVHLPAVVVAMTYASEAVRGLQSASTRPLWMAATAGFVLVVVGARSYRRWSILRAARRHVRESADWPMRFQASIRDPHHASDKTVRFNP